MRHLFLFAAAALLMAAAPSPTEIVGAAPGNAWRPVAPDNLLLFEFAGGRSVAIELAPDFAPAHVANIRLLVRDGWFQRHAAIVRVQDSYVVQWGDPSAKAALPAGVDPRPQGSYERPAVPAGFRPTGFSDVYAPAVGHVDGWPVAHDGKAHWLAHCPGMVGAGRDMPPDTGTGAELYAVIGHGPRHLDRNIALVGRMLAGAERLSALPRGTGAIGFYETPAEHVRIVSVRFASELPGGERPRFEVMRTESPSFAAWADARANRRDAFFIRPSGAADICNLMPPVRQVPGKPS